MDDEVMTDDEKDYLAKNGSLSIEVNDAANIAGASGFPERVPDCSAKTNMLTTTLSESPNQNPSEEGPGSMAEFSSLHDDGRNDAADSKMEYQSSMNNDAESEQSVAQNGENRDDEVCARENTVPNESRERRRHERSRKEKRRVSREEPEDGEILEDGEIASEEDDNMFYGKRPRDDDEYGGGYSKSYGPEKSASSQEESEMKSDASDNEVENAEKPETESRRERRKRRRERKEKRRKKYEAKRKRRKLEYMDYDRANRSPSGPYDSPSDKQSSSPYRSPAGPYESPPGLYDSPSDDDGNAPAPKLVNLIGDNFMDLAVAATEKEDIFQRERREEKKRGGKKKRSHHHHSSKKKPLLDNPRRVMCKFFNEGKCSKVADDCPFSHDFKPAKKTDICKFYLNSVCTKGDNCLFMHGEYPCKFYHTGAQCYQGDNCKFSHEPLTEETKILLEKILEHRDDDSSDDDSSREDGSHGNKIPSLFDIQVYPPVQQSPKKSVGSSGLQSGRPGFYKDSLTSSPSGNSSCSMPPSGPGMGGLGPHRPNIGSPGHPSFLGSRQAPNDCPTQQQSPPQHGCSPPHPQASGPPGSNYPDNDNASQNQDNMHRPVYQPMPSHYHPGMSSDNSEAEKAEERKPVPIEIPSHLPPRQRELFLRIHQQQQLQAASESLEKKNQVAKVDDDNWYSSDEDEEGGSKPKLADILKNLNKQPPKPPASFSPSQSNNQQNSGANSALNIMQMINAIRHPSSPGGMSPARSGGPPVTIGGTGTANNSTSTSAPAANAGSAIGSSGTSMRRDPRRMAQIGNVCAEPKAISSSPATKADPRLHLSKATPPVPQEIVVPPRLPSPPCPLINGMPSVELPFQLYECTTNKIPLSDTVDVFDPRFKNDPRVQKFLANPPPCLKQKARPLDTTKMLKSLGVPNPNRVDEAPSTIVPLPPPPQLPPLPPVVPLPAVGLPPQLLRPQDPRVLRGAPQNSQILGKKPDGKDPQVPVKPIDPRQMRGGPEPKFDPRLSRQPPNAVPPRSQDPRLSRLLDMNNPPPGRPLGDPRAVRQQSPLREPGLPNIILPPLPNANAQPGNPRGPRPPMDQQRFGSRPIPPNRPNNPRPNNPRLNNPRFNDPRSNDPRSNDPRSNNPRPMRPDNRNRNSDSNESQSSDSMQPKKDHRNDPRFKRKPAVEGNHSQKPPPIRKIIGERKGIMEYRSPLGNKMDEPEQSSGYNSYNRPPNANRQMGNNNKPRTSGPEPAPPNLPPSSGNPPPPPVSNEPTQSVPQEMGGPPNLIGGPPPGFPPQIPQTDPNLPYPPMPPPDQPALKDLFKTFDPTASPFC